MSRTLSSILSEPWAIQREGAMAYMPQVLAMLKGEQTRLSKSQIAVMRAPHEPRMDDGNGMVSPNDAVPDTQKKVLILPIKGAILKDGDMCSYGMEDYVRWLGKAERDSSIVGVVLDVDSPGGSSTGMNLIVDALDRFKKPVVSIVRSGMAASAAYGIVNRTREVYASMSSDLFGSVGTYLTLSDWNAYFAEQGLILHDVYASRSTEKNSAFLEALKADPKDPNDPHYAKLRAEFLDPFNEQFIASIKKGRTGLAANEDAWSKGQLVFADQAIELGLIDGYNTLEGAVERVRELSTTSASAKPAFNNHTNNANMNFKTRLSGAIASIASLFTSKEDVTPENIASANAELQSNGVDGVVLVTIAEQALITEATGKVEAAQALVAAAEEKATKAQAAADAAAQTEKDLSAAKATAEAAVTTMNETIASAMKELGIEAAEGASPVAAVLSALQARTTELTTANDTIEKMEKESSNDGQAEGAINTTGDQSDPGSRIDAETEEFLKSATEDMKKMG